MSRDPRRLGWIETVAAWDNGTEGCLSQRKDQILSKFMVLRSGHGPIIVSERFQSSADLQCRRGSVGVATIGPSKHKQHLTVDACTAYTPQKSVKANAAAAGKDHTFASLARLAWKIPSGDQLIWSSDWRLIPLYSKGVGCL
jgi:hypothetical protein